MQRLGGGAAQLQRTVGNQAMLRWQSQTAPKSPDSLQADLRVGRVDDPLEAEADQVADQIMRMPDPSEAPAGRPPAAVQRMCAECEEDAPVRRKAEDAGAVAPPAVQDVLSAPGAPLDMPARAYFEPRFGQDFGDVRVHTGAAAAESARAINALAYTYGQHVVFGAGQFDVSSTRGRHLIAHELAHVVQQEGGHPAIQRMAPCPPHLADDEAVPAGWHAYPGPTAVFHCGFRVILENRDPTWSDPMNECVYDHSGNFVDDNHPYAGCRGTPDTFEATDHWYHPSSIAHGVIDPGGVVAAGFPAFVTSRVYDLDRGIAAAIEIVETARGAVRSVADGLGEMIAVAVLSASASVDPGNWRLTGLPIRSRQHLHVMGAVLGSAALSGNVETLLRNLTRRLDSFSIAGLLDDMAQDINQALRAIGGTTQVTPAALGELSLLHLVELLRTEGILDYVRSPEAIAREQFSAQRAATQTGSQNPTP